MSCGQSSLREHVVRDVPHRHLVFALPKALRPAFRYRRSLLPKLALCAWNAVAANIRSYTGADALPGAIVSIRTAGEFLNWHPHLHVLATAGAFNADGGFLPASYVDVAVLREFFQAPVLLLLLKEPMISPELVEKMRTWRHSGFMRSPATRYPTSTTVPVRTDDARRRVRHAGARRHSTERIPRA
ncbi:MAG: transposase [Acidimicrobiia bacterium]|nr:transposase [Acidimicrobiia bacterium]